MTNVTKKETTDQIIRQAIHDLNTKMPPDEKNRLILGSFYRLRDALEDNRISFLNRTDLEATVWILAFLGESLLPPSNKKVN